MVNKMNLKKFISSILIILISVNCTGCGKTGKENKKAIFAGVEQIVSEEQINIHFAWKDKPLGDETCYSIDIYESAKGQPKYSVDREQLVQNGKLGFSVTVDENTLKFEDLYFEGNKVIFSPQPESPRYEIFSNAEWKLELLLKDYRIYIDDYLLEQNMTREERENIKELKLFKIVDQNSGFEFLYTLSSVHSLELDDLKKL